MCMYTSMHVYMPMCMYVCLYINLYVCVPKHDLVCSLTSPSCHMSPWGHIMLSGPRWRVGLHQSRGCDERWGRDGA